MVQPYLLQYWLFTARREIHPNEGEKMQFSWEDVSWIPDIGSNLNHLFFKNLLTGGRRCPTPRTSSWGSLVVSVPNVYGYRKRTALCTCSESPSASPRKAAFVLTWKGIDIIREKVEGLWTVTTTCRPRTDKIQHPGNIFYVFYLYSTLLPSGDSK